MICIEGKTAFSGIAIGPIREFAKKSSAVTPRSALCS